MAALGWILSISTFLGGLAVLHDLRAPQAGHLAMLLLLASNPGVTLSKEDLFSAVWGRDSADTLKVVANTVSNLRRKMGGSHTYIRTVRGGYVFSAVSATA